MQRFVMILYISSIYSDAFILASCNTMARMERYFPSMPRVVPLGAAASFSVRMAKPVPSR